ncbi:alpha/beta fold hydrolase [Antrihabitans sp. YC2-6]|uniref:alpha/beta fold hydrolase n=1 Tax=Antrihabitans sp. YC2-6 TaxID=2799498 RepID=UPI0018F397E5|nr:alpha/beta hydrolase [Antrihabitans sp. YC2-6]MBJ8345732.1 alpha/beta hydrolase [Antrihabitans sp. YC2-6]
MIAETRVCYNGVHTRELSVAGDGPPIVLFHGFADSADTWRPMLERLEQAGRAAVAVDLPGFGAADARTAGPLLPQFDGFADAVVAVHRPAVLVGNSLGSATAVRTATRHGRDTVCALFTIDDPIGARHRLARSARRSDYRRLFDVVGVLPIPRAVLAVVVREALRRVLYGPGLAADPDVLAKWVAAAPSMATISALGRDAIRYARETEGGHRRPSIECPVFILHGAKDRIIPVDSSRVLHEAVPGSELVVLPRSGHCPQLDDPAQVTGLLLDFLQRTGVLAQQAG